MSCDANIRKHQWKVLTVRQQLWGDKWLLAGDFNDILSNEEKWGGRARDDRSFKDFNSFIEHNSLVDLGFTDHSMLLIDNWPRVEKRKSRFFFNKIWLKREDINQVVEQAWKQPVEGNSMYRITRQVANCRVALLKWKNNFTGNSLLRIIQVKLQIKEIKDSKDSGGKDKIVDLKKQLKEAYSKEEQYWAQKARIDWLREGDKNTKFFHACVKGRRRKNRMLNIQKEDGTWTKSEEEFGKEVADYYRVLFSSSGSEGIAEILYGIPPTITTEMNATLTREVDGMKIKSALFSMNPNKAPGQDGFSNLLKQAEGDKRISGMKIRRIGPSMTHLFFTDDSLMFCKAEREKARELIQILRKYEKGSGQSINLEKSSVFFSSNVSHQRKGEVTQSLGTIQVTTQGKYLGLPMVITRSKQQVFGYIKGSISRRMNSWKNKLLSQGGKEVLLKAVSMAMPGRLAKEKKEEGLGFKDLQNLNKALLAKQNCNIRRVDVLIGGFRWRKPLVLRAFNRKDANEILDIPISISGREDNNYWLHSGNGIYMVNSGYKALSRETTQHRGKKADEAETSLANSNGKQWKWLWKLKVKSKIKPSFGGV
ncbi:uncharacterized protein LOC113765985 [Coffea eugenioides]|uniref:uncharacterized protein LOC113765985 n=1 Tax=Coffea eugenioides TaxID=49369 RepID=UPI000F606E37|nr:uncharacterized protein LOC113765985 [Coffea eugenioides]